VVPSDIPTAPIRPNRLQSILFACIIGCVFGLFLVFFQEYMDDRINSSDETSRLLKTPALASIAAFASPEPKLLLQMTGTETAIAESYRLLRTNIYFAAIDSPIRILLVTSAASNEGKSTTAINLALAMAIDGRKVILLDCDLRRPSLHKYFGVLSTVGVTDVLLGHSSIEDALQRRPDLPDFAMLPAGTPPPNPSELLNSKAFRNLVEELKGMADIVIIDSSPVLVAADASILASQSDGVLFVVESGATKKAAAKRATEILRQAHSKIVGFVYNKVTKNASDEYDYHKYRYAEPTSLSTVGSSSLNLPLLKSLESDHDHNHLKHNA
jgi:receptor protein-tyrosine kinase